MKQTPSIPTTSDPPSGTYPWGVGIGAVVLLITTVLVIRSCVQSQPVSRPPADPTPAGGSDGTPYFSPFRNTKPGVAYTGDAACIECHKSHGDSYHKHPMGRSITPLDETNLDEHVRSGGNPFDALGVRFSTERRGARLVHREVVRDADGSAVAESTIPVAFAIGSGTHAYSYLITRDGVLTQSPVTWFRQKAAFDVSPGFGPSYENFERPIVPGCLFCHSNHVDPVPDTLNAYRQPVFRGHTIGCERCHGPGEIHVRDRKAKFPVEGEFDTSIVNPTFLPPKLREDVCSQCHLGGKDRVVRRGRNLFDYRPGMPLEDFLRVFVMPPALRNGNRVAGHVEQMAVSRCFMNSGGEMGCVSCHDPHTTPLPAEKETYYRSKCLDCHAKKGCTDTPANRQAQRDDCTACHMPRAESNVGHVSLTDHRIPRRPDSAVKTDADSLVATRNLVPFGREVLDANDTELIRDLAIGLVTRARLGSESIRFEISRAWLPVLQRAVRDHPDDLPARECLGVALAWQGNLTAALAACEETLASVPRREVVLSDAAYIAQRLGLTEKSLDFWRRALAINPSSSRYRFEVASGLTALGDWAGAVAECRKVLAMNGGHVPSRLLLVQYYKQTGDKPRARAELLTVLALRPSNEAALRQQFAEVLR